MLLRRTILFEAKDKIFEEMMYVQDKRSLLRGSVSVIEDRTTVDLHLKSWFFFIDRRAIPDVMVWRHLNAAIDDPRPATVDRAEVKEEPHLNARSTLQRLPFYCTPPVAADVVIPDHTLEDLAVGTPSSKIVAKAKASQKRKASTSGTISSYVTKRTSDDDDDVVCVKILLVLTPELLQPSDGGDPIETPTFRPAPSFRNVFGDATHMDFFPFSASPYYATYPEDGVARNCVFTREEWDASYQPTFWVLTKEVFKDPAVYKTIVDQFPTPGEMVQVESLSDVQLAAKMSVLHCMMMSHGGELLARYRGMNQSHHEYVLSIYSRLKGYEEKVASLSGLELQVCALKKQVSGLNDKLSSSDAYFAKSKAKGKERKKKIKSLTKSIDNFHSKVVHLSVALNQATILEVEKDEEILRLKDTPLDAGFERGLSMHRTKDEFVAVLKKMANFMLGTQDRIAEASPLVAQTDYAFLNKIFEHATKPLSVILQLEPEKLESTVTPASKSLEFSANVNFIASSVAPEHNEEMVNAEVDGLGPKMTDDTVAVKSRHAFVQGISVALDDAVELVKVGSWRVSSSPNDVVVARSAGEKGDGLDPSFAACEEAAANPSGV
ncbi:hypothetical protein Tco_0217756 [Tanacetum coccineum]